MLKIMQSFNHLLNICFCALLLTACSLDSSVTSRVSSGEIVGDGQSTADGSGSGQSDEGDDLGGTDDTNDDSDEQGGTDAGDTCPGHGDDDECNEEPKCKHPESVNYDPNELFGMEICYFEVCKDESYKEYDADKIQEYQDYIANRLGGAVHHNQKLCENKIGGEDKTGCSFQGAGSYTPKNYKADVKEDGTCEWEPAYCLNSQYQSFNEEFHNTFSQYILLLESKEISYQGNVLSQQEQLCTGKKGCTNIKAENYNPNAEVDDKSCVFKYCLDGKLLDGDEKVKQAYLDYQAKHGDVPDPLEGECMEEPGPGEGEMCIDVIDEKVAENNSDVINKYKCDVIAEAIDIYSGDYTPFELESIKYSYKACTSMRTCAVTGRRDISAALEQVEEILGSGVTIYNNKIEDFVKIGDDRPEFFSKSVCGRFNLRRLINDDPFGDVPDEIKKFYDKYCYCTDCLDDGSSGEVKSLRVVNYYMPLTQEVIDFQWYTSGLVKDPLANSNTQYVVKAVDGENESGNVVSGWSGTVQFLLYRDQRCTNLILANDLECQQDNQGNIYPHPVQYGSQNNSVKIQDATLNCSPKDNKAIYVQLRSNENHKSSCRKIDFKQQISDKFIEAALPDSGVKGQVIEPSIRAQLFKGAGQPDSSNNVTVVSIAAYKESSCEGENVPFTQGSTEQQVSSGKAFFNNMVLSEKGDFWLKLSADGYPSVCKGPLSIDDSGGEDGSDNNTCDPQTLAYGQKVHGGYYGGVKWDRCLIVSPALESMDSFKPYLLGNLTLPALQYCQELDLNGYTDWVLPHLLEFPVIYENLVQGQPGGQPYSFNANQFYWVFGPPYPAQGQYVAYRPGVDSLEQQSFSAHTSLKVRCVRKIPVQQTEDTTN